MNICVNENISEKNEDTMSIKMSGKNAMLKAVVSGAPSLSLLYLCAYILSTRLILYQIVYLGYLQYLSNA